jgi:competence protein ComFC
VIRQYKYSSVKNVRKILSELVKDKLFYVLEKEKIDYIIPVPIHKKRRFLRGFNQTEEILKSMNLKYLNMERVINTKAMYKLLNKKNRKSNIKGSFKIDKKSNLEGKNILIFDDIITTGTTVEEIIKTINKIYKVDQCIVFSMMAANTIKIKGGR